MLGRLKLYRQTGPAQQSAPRLAAGFGLTITTALLSGAARAAEVVGANSPIGAAQMRPTSDPVGGITKLDGFTINELAHQALPYVSGILSLGLAVLLAKLFWRSWRASKARGDGLLSGISHAIEETVLTNWRLALLGATSVVLSLASGYTTWDGLTHFTCGSPEPNLIVCPGAHVLSAMATFGIQGVMLIAAWLIGESFAAGMRGDGQSSAKPHSGLADSIARYGLLVAVGCILAYLSGISTSVSERMSANSAWAPFVDKGLLWGGALLLVAAIAVAISRPSVLEPYIWAVRTIVSNAMLWLMFLACISISVFFSFDSLFSTIFPKDQRQRAAEIRAQKEVGEIVNLTGATAAKRRIEEAEKLFGTPAWDAYETNLSNLTKAAQGSTGEIEKYFVEQMEARRRGIASQQERIATAQSGKAGLANRKISLTDELARIKGERPGLAAEYNQHKTELDAKGREVDAKRVEAMAEERGVEGTGKVGRGAVFRQRDTELAKMRDEYKIKEERTKDAQKRLAGVETRIAQIERELSTLDGDLAKLTGETQTAEERIKVAQDGAQQEETIKFDPARMLPAFERSRGEFRENPTIDGLDKVQQLCGQLVGAMNSTPATRQKVTTIDCDPKAASEAAARVFALNNGLKTYAENCAGGSKLPQDKGTDGLLQFGRKCLQDSALSGKDAEEVGARLASVDLNRDDKAHRFVVTWNAFLDHNRLAYLALGIAIALDGLVFLSGLFGANAVRSPLTDMPNLKGRSASQLDSVIDAALYPHKFEAARAVLHSMRAITQRDGFSQEIRIDPHDPHANDINRVINAASTIGAVRHKNVNEGIYEVRGELYEYLSSVAKREFERSKEHVNLAQLEKAVTVALLPKAGSETLVGNVDTVLHYMHPINEENKDGFTSEILLDEVERDQMRPVKSVLNAGASYKVVRRDRDASQRFELHSDMYKTLANVRARMLATATAIEAPRYAPPPAVEDYPRVLTPQTPAIEPGIGPERQLTSSPSTTEADDTDYYMHYWRTLLSRIGLTPQKAASVIDNGEMYEVVRIARRRLETLARGSIMLDALLRSFEKQCKELIDATYSQLEYDTRGHAHNRDAMMEAKRHVDENLRYLMLHPDIDLVQQLILGIEQAATPDDGLRPGEQELKDNLREIHDRLLASYRDPGSSAEAGKFQPAAVVYPREYAKQQRRG